MDKIPFNENQLAMNLAHEKADCVLSASPETKLPPPREDNSRDQDAGTEFDPTQPQDSTIQSWCPDGSVNGGICAPSKNNRYDWMSRYAGARTLPIGECILLGTHNAGMDKDAPWTASMKTCQDVPVFKQLAWGARVLDLRVRFLPNAVGPERFGLFHDVVNGRYLEIDVLDALLAYRASYGAYKEIVILDFHQFENFTPAAHQELATVLKTKFGLTLVPRACKEAAIMQLWAMGMNTVVAYNHEGGYDDLFWPGVNQRWIGKNTPSKREMEAFIKRVGDEPKEFGALRSVQAAYYSPLLTPKDLSEDLMGWFAAKEDGGPISYFHIISTDWSFRQRLADNVIYANGIRSQLRGAYVTSASPNTDGAWINTSAYSIFRLENGDFVYGLGVKHNTSKSTSIILVLSDATLDSALSWRAGVPARTIKTGTRLLLRAAPGEFPELIWDNGI